MLQRVVSDKTEAALWPVVLVVVSAVATAGFACVTPFAAFALAAAYVLPARSALFAVAGVWLANQVVGFTAMSYPWDLETFAWGLAIGAAALLATGSASYVLQRRGERGVAVTLGIALLTAFCMYEAALLMVTPMLGGEEAFTPAIIAGFALLNLAWVAALVGAVELWRSAKPWAMRVAGGRPA